MSEAKAKQELDNLISDARYRCYRPIRIAEILYHSRTEGNIHISNVESYRVKSGKWRDKISKRLTGKKSTSSKSYQKDFSNLMEPKNLKALDRINQKQDGIVESYIYHRLKEDKWKGLIDAQDYVKNAQTANFSFEYYMNLAENGGLEEDAILEIAVYALFNGITRELDATAKLELQSPDENILSDFSDFVETFLGLEQGDTLFETEVRIHRAGKGTYAADKSVDIGTNFGTMVQVKHVTLDSEKARDIEENTHVDRVVVVCREAEKSVIRRLSNQLGFEKIQGIVTISELKEWYNLCFGQYESSIGKKVLSDLKQEFEGEFQKGDWRIPDIDELLQERGYQKEDLQGIWRI